MDKKYQCPHCNKKRAVVRKYRGGYQFFCLECYADGIFDKSDKISLEEAFEILANKV